MSGIAGHYRWNSDHRDPGDQARMAATLKSLGPDRYTEVCGDRVVLGHLLMDRTPQGQTPCRALDAAGDGVLLTGDLRLDNRNELASQLELDREAATTWSDSELLLRAYRCWGLDCPRYLLGDFAFALWDSRRQRLLLARDHFGVRPLFYAAVGPTLYFSSALRGLLALPQVPRDLDEQMLARFLIFSSSNASRTLYSAVRSVMPRHTLVIGGDGESHLRPFWQPTSRRRVRFKTDGEYVEGFGEILRESVRTRIAGSSRPGVMVSGGLDSSAIAALVAGLAPDSEPVGVAHALDPSSPAAHLDERRYLEDLRRHLPAIEVLFVTANGISPLGFVEQVFNTLCQPVQAGLNYVQKALLAEASGAGCDVVLAGFGGDEITSVSHPRYPVGLLRAGRLCRLADEFAAETQREGFSTRRFWQLMFLAQLPRSVWHALHRWRFGYLGGFRTSLAEPFARQQELRSELNTSMYWDLTAYAPPNNRRALSEAVLGMCDESVDPHGWVTEAADYGQALRFPLADLRLVEYCLAVPPDQLRRAGIGRRLMRAATAETLPASITSRLDKSTFGPDFALRVQAELESLRRAFSRFRKQELSSSLLDFETLEEAMDRVGSQGPDGADQAVDCLQVLLPAYYLGRFLELRNSETDFAKC